MMIDKPEPKKRPKPHVSWPCLRGSNLNQGNEKKTRNSERSRVAKSVRLFTVAQRVFDLAEATGPNDVGQVIVNATDTEDNIFGIKLAAEEALEFFESGAAMARELVAELNEKREAQAVREGKRGDAK